MISKKDDFGVYIHIPFCKRKCCYCDFLSFPCEASERSRYVDALVSEIEFKKSLFERRKITSVFFGGGTPSILEAEQLVKILKKLYEVGDIAPDAEITVECNPGTVSREKLAAYRQAGVNRLSFGVQSSIDSELASLGRIHSFHEAEEAAAFAREAGFTNISVDVMFGIPGQTVASYRQTLERICELSVSHISAYSLIIEEGTPFFELYGEEDWKTCSETVDELPVAGLPNESKVVPVAGLPSEDDEREMYSLTKSVLAEKGFKQYEISNYAVEGLESRHNTLYWKRSDYIGFGLGAASLLDHVRYKNTTDFIEYIKSSTIYEEEEKLSESDEMAEFMFLGLRMMEGVSAKDFFDTFNVDLFEIYGKVIEKYTSIGLMEVEGDRIRLTEKGVEVSNVVFADFL